MLTKEEKSPLHLVPPEIIYSIADVLGATGGEDKKYKERDWETNDWDWSVTYSALLRHLTKWWAGENIDEETGFSHLDHAATRLSFLIAYEKRGISNDDRP